MRGLVDLAREAGAMQLGEEGLPSGPQFIFSLAELERFADGLRRLEPLIAAPELPPLPY